MDLLQLEHFLAVAEERSFTRAAERVSRTQPAVSQNIKKLEDTLGVPLFARDMPDLSLTEAGRILVEHARKMLRLRDEAMRRMAELHNLRSGSLSIAAHESAALYLLPGPMRDYFERFPDIKVAVHRSRPEDIPRQVMDREIDIGFVKDQPPFRELQSTEIHLDQMILDYRARTSSGTPPPCRRDRPQSRAIRRAPSVFDDRADDPATLRVSRQPLPDRGRALELREHQAFCAAGPGACGGPSHHRDARAGAGALTTVPVVGLDMPRRTLMICRAHGYMSDSAQRFVDIAREFDWAGWLEKSGQPVVAMSPLRAIR